MLSRRIGGHIRHNVVGYVALFIAMTMAPAWAASIGSSDIKKNAVKSKHIKDANVAGADLAAGAVTSPTVADGSLASADLLDGSVGNADLANGAVGSGKLADNVVTSAKVADNAITGGDLFDGGVGTADLATGAVDTAQLDDLAVTSAKLAGDAVNSSKIENGTVADADLAPRENLQTPALLACDGATNWTSPVAFARPVGFWKDRSGVVHLQGSVGCAGNAVEGGPIFNLPPGYRPAFGNGVVRWAALSGGVTVSQIAVLDSGGFSVVYDGPNSTTADDYISLDGLTFRAEQ